MSLDFYLEGTNGVQLFSANITHNLNKMADVAGIYDVLWRPDENGITTAIQCVDPLKTGLLKMSEDPEFFREFNSPNGWGTYDHFLDFVANVLIACCKHPKAKVVVSR